MLNKTDIGIYQKTQAMSLRKMLSVARSSSGIAIQRLLQIEPIDHRNMLLNVCFAARLHNSTDKSIPAVRIWRNTYHENVASNVLALWRSCKKSSQTRGLMRTIQHKPFKINC